MRGRLELPMASYARPLRPRRVIPAAARPPLELYNCRTLLVTALAALS